MTKAVGGFVYDVQRVTQKLHYVKPSLHFHRIVPLQNKRVAPAKVSKTSPKLVSITVTCLGI